MRLLWAEADGNFRLAEFSDEKIPPYAILSHTWGADDEEVSFRDIVDGRGKNKPGYKKIRFCAQQARKDGLKFFWVDSCCIDKSSSTELSEAINSMFRWYQRATKCYAYLSDISIPKPAINGPSSSRARKQSIKSSKWFERSWTLQELLAPTSVEFFTREWEPLGNKRTLEKEIHDRTKIPIRALRGMSLSHFGVNERLSWARGRQAKREEDKAYSLLGIFDVHMPLIYGEGWEHAYARLRKEINPPTGASHFSSHDCSRQFNTCTGTQTNNTGSGNVLFGDFNAPVRFG
ncbi:hypothetical protein EKO27_g5017 [Xylaria grammica]|uniref:Heterokaryon incompatibility domain-containing protein n=1 Tax=Xylaria grammica TaxID=363999 RepID=A0A439D6R5_9PEZI|nr:hypothetical protein EKO27_g5017 [Xylaria grammica]